MTDDERDHRAGERRASAGVGQSEIGRRLYRDPLDLTLDACLAAIDDAGLTRDDIDGVGTYPGHMDQPPGLLRRRRDRRAGRAAPEPRLVRAAGSRRSGQLGSVINACLAVASGLANHVLCFRTVYGGSAPRATGGRSGLGGGGGGSGGAAQGRRASCSGRCRSARRRPRTGSR